MTEKDVEVVTIGTGGTDSFHAPARALYESLGCVPVSRCRLLQATVALRSGHHAYPEPSG